MRDQIRRIIGFPAEEDKMMWTGHWMYVIIPVCGAVFLVQDALENPKHGPFAFIQYVGGIALVLWLWSIWCEFRVHARQLCERCVASHPLDPQRVAARWQPGFRLIHSHLWQSVLVINIGWIAVTAVLHVPEGMSYAGSACITIAVVALVIVGRQHNRLQPWCPWCNWGDGGDEEVSPDVPDPAISK